MGKKQLNPNQLFLIDGVGALVSAILLGFVLVSLKSYIGMPTDVLYLLACIALLLSGYSLSCYFIEPRNGHLFLTVIAIANVTYSIITIYLIWRFYKELSLLGISYFVVELFIVLILVRFELFIAFQKE